MNASRIAGMRFAPLVAIALAATNAVGVPAGEMRPAIEKESGSNSDGIAVFPHGPATDGVAAFLLAHANQYRVGEPIPLSYGLVLVGRGLKGQVDLQNPDFQEGAERYGGLVKRVWQPLPAVDPINQSWFEVTGPNGKKLEYHGSFPHRTRRTPTDENTVVLQHGCFVGRTTQPELDLIRGFTLTKPGTYRVRWVFHEAGDANVWGGKLTSNEIVIEIQ